MGDFYLPLLGLLLILGFIFRDGFVFTLVYLLAVTYALTRFWRTTTTGALLIERSYVPRAFPGETVRVKLKVENRSRLPIVWLQVSESLSMDLAPRKNVSQVVTLGPKSSTTIEYDVFPRKRGYYKLGPVFLNSGDVLGLLMDEQRFSEADHLIVYPEIYRLGNVSLPSWSPLGSVQNRLPIFEDPSRAAGKRPYAVGDSLRRVDWKSTASSGQMQVKVLDSSIALETMVFLNFCEDDYNIRHRQESAELAVLSAASLANWVSERKSPVGLVTNGLDPLLEGEVCRMVPARSGRGHLMRVLETLARVQLDVTLPFAEVIRREQVHLPWGATMVMVTSEVQPQLFDEMLSARKRGLNILLVLCGAVTGVSEIRRKARTYGVNVVYIARRMDLEIWE